MIKSAYDYIALEKQIELLNEYQGHLLDREGRLRLENDALKLELDKKDAYIAQLEKAVQRVNQ